MCSLTEHVVGCTCFRLRRLSHFALHRLTLNFSNTETSTDVGMKSYIVELYTYSYITFCVCALGHPAMIQLVSVGMIMRILLVTVIIFTARCNEQIAWVVNTGYLAASKVLELATRHGYFAWGSYCKHSVPLVRGLVAGHLSVQRLTVHPLQTTKIESSQFSTHYIVNIFLSL
jgi:hypothetical protein